MKLFKILIILIIIASLGVGYRIYKGQTSTLTYQTAKAEKGTIVEAISASGKVISSNIMAVNTNASGVVVEVYVKDGDIVSRGQQIANISLDLEGAQKQAAAWASYLSSKNSLESAKVGMYTTQSEMFSKWKTYKDLAESSAYDTPEERSLPQFMIVQDDWLAAEAKYKNQSSTISQAQASLNSNYLSYQLSSATVIAQSSGEVNSLSVVKGMVIEAGATKRVAVIESKSVMLLGVTLTEIDVVKVKPGLKATVIFDSQSQKTYTGKVVTVDRVGETSSSVTVYPVTIALDTEVVELLPNMAGSAKIVITAKSDVVVVPASAVTETNGQASVRILIDGKMQDASVQIGIESDTEVEIISGVNVGDEVIIGTVSNASATRNSTSVFGGGGVFRSGSFGGAVRVGR